MSLLFLSLTGVNLLWYRKSGWLLGIHLYHYPQVKESNLFDAMFTSSNSHGTSYQAVHAINMRSGRNNNNKLIPRREHRIYSRIEIIYYSNFVKGEENLSATLYKRGEVLAINVWTSELLCMLQAITVHILSK